MLESNIIPKIFENQLYGGLEKCKEIVEKFLIGPVIGQGSFAIVRKVVLRPQARASTQAWHGENSANNEQKDFTLENTESALNIEAIMETPQNGHRKFDGVYVLKIYDKYRLIDAARA